MTQHVIVGNQSKIEQSFQDFYAKHPEVYDDFVILTRDR